MNFEYQQQMRIKYSQLHQYMHTYNIFAVANVSQRDEQMCEVNQSRLRHLVHGFGMKAHVESV